MEGSSFQFLIYYPVCSWSRVDYNTGESAEPVAFHRHAGYDIIGTHHNTTSIAEMLQCNVMHMRQALNDSWCGNTMDSVLLEVTVSDSRNLEEVRRLTRGIVKRVCIAKLRTAHAVWLQHCQAAEEAAQHGEMWQPMDKPTPFVVVCQANRDDEVITLEQKRREPAARTGPKASDFGDFLAAAKPMKTKKKQVV